MAGNREQYYELDDIGVIGVSGERSPEEIRHDAEEMSTIIRAYKLGRASVNKKPARASKRRAKTAKKKYRNAKPRAPRKTTTIAK